MFFFNYFSCVVFPRVSRRNYIANFHTTLFTLHHTTARAISRKRYNNYMAFTKISYFVCAFQGEESVLFLRCWGFILFLQMQIFNSSRVPIYIVAWAKHGLIIIIFKRLCVCQKVDFFNIIFDSESSEEIIVIDASLTLVRIDSTREFFNNPIHTYTKRNA